MSSFLPHRSVASPTNPLGLHGFAFVEFAAPPHCQVALHALMQQMGFTAVSRHRQYPITLYKQGDVVFLVNDTPDSFAAHFAQAHGPSACGFGLRFTTSVEDVHAHLLAKGATPVVQGCDHRAAHVPMVEGIGGARLYLVGQDQAAQDYALDYLPLERVVGPTHGFGLTTLDHLTHNVYGGNLDVWADHYERWLGFKEIRYFDIKGVKTGLVSRAMMGPDQQVRIPINESSDPKSQINEYLRTYHGEGIQHIALATSDIYATVEAMRLAGVPFLDTPDTYYDVIDQRVPGHREDVAQLRANRILIDADPAHPEQQLLQIFTQNVVGPIFFEIIQRKGNEGFGEGNFKALFEAIERDQERRGVL
jgi:4-hydroxyphenylpyruvate dioxygenase